jgi:hypothetical protein
MQFDQLKRRQFITLLGATRGARAAGGDASGRMDQQQVRQ